MSTTKDFRVATEPISATDEMLDVYQRDSIVGLPLGCGGHEDKGWCPCRTMTVTEGHDGPTLWHSLLIQSADNTFVDVNITKDTVLRVQLLLIDQWSSERDMTQMSVGLSPAVEFGELEPFKSDPSMYRLGTLNFNEGRGVLRELIINRFAGIFVMNVGCKSKFHGFEEGLMFQASRKHPARAWDWDFLKWAHGGVCPPCHERAMRLRHDALASSSEDIERFAAGPRWPAMDSKLPALMESKKGWSI